MAWQARVARYQVVRFGSADLIYAVIATKVDPGAAVIGAAIPAAPGIGAVAIGIISAAVVARIMPAVMPDWNAEISGISRVEPGRQRHVTAVRPMQRERSCA